MIERRNHQQTLDEIGERKQEKDPIARRAGE
jgi:hypothetical protein